MSFNDLILSALAAIVAFLLYMVGLQMVSKKESMSQRMQRMVGPTLRMETPEPDKTLADPLRVEQTPSTLAAAARSFLRLFGIDTDNYRQKLQLRFHRAGIVSTDAPVYYLIFKFIAGPILFILGLYVAFLPGGGLTRVLHVCLAFMLVVLGVRGGEVYLDNRQHKRQRILQNSFPDALDLLLVCVDSGLALDGALARVCKELWRARPVIAQELNRTRIELTLLNDRAQALTNMAERTDLMAFRSLVTTLLQSERFGTSLTETLRVLSEDYRNTRLLLAEEKAGRLPVLITIPLVAFLMPAIFIMILAPGLITAFKNLGNM